MPSTIPLGLCDPSSYLRRRIRRLVASAVARGLVLMPHVRAPPRPYCSLIPHLLVCRRPRVSLACQSQAIPGHSQLFMRSLPQGAWDGLPSTTYLVIVPMRPLPMDPDPSQPSTPVRSPHLPFAGARVHAFPHRTQASCVDHHIPHTPHSPGAVCGAGKGGVVGLRPPGATPQTAPGECGVCGMWVSTHEACVR